MLRKYDQSIRQILSLEDESFIRITLLAMHKGDQRTWAIDSKISCLLSNILEF